MDFGETLLAAQRNQKGKNSNNAYYRTKFEPPKKEQKPASRLSTNIQKFLEKKEQEEKRKQDEARRKRDELLAMRDPKATRKIQKMLKVIKSANKAVIEDAIDHENTAVTLTGADQPDQDDYGYESQEASALYRKIMDKYSKIPEEEKFPPSKKAFKKDLDSTRERMKAALQREEEPQPRQRKSRTHNSIEKEESPPPQPEIKTEKPKIRKPLPPPIDFNQLLKLAEKNKDEPLPIPILIKKPIDSECERPMTKKQRKEYEEELARKEARRRRLESANKPASVKQDRARTEVDKKPESATMRIPKIGEKNNISLKNSKISESIKPSSSGDVRRSDQNIIKSNKSELIPRSNNKVQNYNSEKLSTNRIPLKSSKDDEKIRSSAKESYIERGQSSKLDDRLKNFKPTEKGRSVSEDDRRKTDRSKTQAVEGKFVNRNGEKNKLKREDVKYDYSNKSDIQSKSDKETNRGYAQKVPNIASRKDLLKQELARRQELKEKMALKEKMLLKEKKLFGDDNRVNKQNGTIQPEKRTSGDVKLKDSLKMSTALSGDKKSVVSSSKSKILTKPENKTFDFDKHVNSLKKLPEHGNARNSSKFPPSDVRRQMSSGDTRTNQKALKRRIVDSDSEYDSEMDDFIDDGDDDLNYSAAIKDIFGYDKNKYRGLEDDDDDQMESSFAQQMREEYISKKIGIMEDLEDMRMEAMEKKKGKKRRRISDDDD